MTFQGSIIKEQGVTFAVVIAKSHVLSNKTEADGMIATFQARVFPGLPVVLMAQDSRGTPTYYGRQDISKFLAHVPLASIPWREYTLT